MPGAASLRIQQHFGKKCPPAMVSYCSLTLTPVLEVCSVSRDCEEHDWLLHWWEGAGLYIFNKMLVSLCFGSRRLLEAQFLQVDLTRSRMLLQYFKQLPPIIDLRAWFKVRLNSQQNCMGTEVGTAHSGEAISSSTFHERQLQAFKYNPHSVLNCPARVNF